MRKLEIGVVLIFVATLFMVIMHHANAATLSPSARTCAAFAGWNHHRTNANLDTMVIASLSAPWANLGNDVNVVYADVRGHNTIDLAGDVAGITSDCKHAR